MLCPNHLRFRTWAFVGAAVLLFCVAFKATIPDSSPAASVTIVVKEADTGDPISQARLTLTFHQQGGRHRSISYSAKTSAQGRYRFTDVPKGTIVLLVTAEHHQSLGKEVEVEEDNQVIEVKLKRPQPLL